MQALEHTGHRARLTLHTVSPHNSQGSSAAAPSQRHPRPGTTPHGVCYRESSCSGLQRWVSVSQGTTHCKNIPDIIAGGVFLKHGLCRVAPLLRGRSWLPRTTRALSCRLRASGRQGQVPPGLSASPPLCLSHPNSGHAELLHVTLHTPPPPPPHSAFPHLLPTSPAQRTLTDPSGRTQEVPSSMKPACRPLDCGTHAPRCAPVPPRGLIHVRTPHSSAPCVHHGLILSFRSLAHSRPSAWDALFSVT